MKVGPMHKTILSLLVLALPMLLPAQQPAPHPDARGRAHLFYHAKSKAMLLVDGYVNYPDAPQNNVWKWDGKNWKELKASGPGPRAGNAAALHSKTGNIITFGGWGKGGPPTDSRNDFWEFDGKGWKKIATDSIATHDHNMMVYAAHLDAFVLYGGFISGAPPVFDTVTWLYRKGRFTALRIPGPGNRGNAAFAYDPLRKKAVLFGGKGYDVPADLWEFDGKVWMQIPVSDVGMTTGMQMTYSDALKQIVLHGGTGTYTWDGLQLQKIAEGGPSGTQVALGYDPLRKVVAAYGGYASNEEVSAALWELENGVWRKVSDNGVWKRKGDKTYERVNTAAQN